MEGELGFNDLDVTIINMYAPYKDRDCFSTSLSDSGLLSVENLILEGDLNFTMSLAEIWGHRAKLDLMVDFFKDL